MRSQGTAQELERRRRLAVTRVKEGYTAQEVADFLGVTRRSVNRWIGACRQAGSRRALQSKPVPGRPRKLTSQQEKIVLGWLTKSPRVFGFESELWTSQRLGALLWEQLGVCFNSNYLVAWLGARHRSAQKPGKRALEQDDEAVARWVAEDWPRLQKKPKPRGPASSSSTKAAFFSIPWFVAPGRAEAAHLSGVPSVDTATKSPWWQP